MTTKTNVDIRLGKYKDKTLDELEKISRDFNEEQEKLFNERVRGDSEK